MTEKAEKAETSNPTEVTEPPPPPPVEDISISVAEFCVKVIFDPSFKFTTESVKDPEAFRFIGTNDPALVPASSAYVTLSIAIALLLEPVNVVPPVDVNVTTVSAIVSPVFVPAKVSTGELPLVVPNVYDVSNAEGGILTLSCPELK